jgi:hypothetical protein
MRFKQSDKKNEEKAVFSEKKMLTFQTRDLSH